MAAVDIEERVRQAIGAHIKQARERHKTPRGRVWSQAKLAYVLSQASGYTTTANYVSKWERGDRKPGYEWGPVIERVLGLDLVAIETAERAALDVPDDPPPVVVPELGSDDVNRRHMLGLGALTVLESTRRDLARVVEGSERADLDEWEAVAAEYGHSYLVTPPEILIRQLAADLPAVRALIDIGPGRLWAGYCRVASQLAVITARTWSSLDEYQKAWRWWRTARVLADASGDQAARVMCRGEEVVMGLYEHRPISVLLDVAAEAVEIGGDTATRGAVGLWAGIAQANATIGRTGDAVHALERLERLTEALPSSVTDASDSVHGWPEYRTRHAQSYVHTQLGDTAAAGVAQDQALALYRDSLPASRAQVELHRARCLVLDRDPRGGLARAAEVLAALPDGFRNDAVVLSVARKVLDAVPLAMRTHGEALALSEALRC
ncbi:helix-turn-helix domain-containing protein [Pseudonocardia acaciae]|uniref:helix-turn-helix domain-containing protein n=1 Tax=Pseudonocardia acaciae TaxID=551276 RepID=UPI00068896A0|nr:helix-turn-helix transcriptional regulator [Pseudonocardia acaciae]